MARKPSQRVVAIRELREYDVDDLVALLGITSGEIVRRFPRKVEKFLREQEIPELGYRYAEEYNDDDEEEEG